MPDDSGFDLGIMISPETHVDDGTEMRHGILRMREGDMKVLARSVRTMGMRRGGFMYASAARIMIDDDGLMMVTIPTNTGVEHGAVRYLEIKFFAQLSQDELKHFDYLDSSEEGEEK